MKFKRNQGKFYWLRFLVVIILSIYMATGCGWFDDDDDAPVPYNAPAGAPPEANAGPNQYNIPLGSTVVLDGSATGIGDREPLTYTWSIERKPLRSVAKITNPNTIKPTFKPDKIGSYMIKLLVNDGVNESEDFMVIHVIRKLIDITEGTKNLTGTWNLTWDEGTANEEFVPGLVLKQDQESGTIYFQCGGLPWYIFTVDNNSFHMTISGDPECNGLTFTIDDDNTLSCDNGQGAFHRFRKVSAGTGFSYAENSSLSLQGSVCGNVFDADSDTVCVATEGPADALTKIKISTAYQGESIGIEIANPFLLQANTTYDIQADGIDMKLKSTYVFDCNCDDYYDAIGGTLTVNVNDGAEFIGTFNLTLSNGDTVSGFFIATLASTSWQPLNTTGFEDAEDKVLFPSAFYNGRLYAISSVSGSETKPGNVIQVWEYDGSIWRQVNEDGFGDLNNSFHEGTGVAVFNGKLYVSATNEQTGLQVWEYDGSI